MSVAEVGSSRYPLVPCTAFALSVVALAVALPLGPYAMLGAAGFTLLAVGVALRDMTAPVFTWATGIVLFVWIVWLVPIKKYTLPIPLPFNLEYYRLFLLGLVTLLGFAIIRGRATLRAAGMGMVVLFLSAAAVASAIVNLHEITASSGPGSAIKALSFFLSFLVVFVLVASTVQAPEQVNRVVRALVIGGFVVALFALYEKRSGYNIFDHLGAIPGFKRLPRDEVLLRAGQPRVFASAQHPIALGTVLLLVAPLAAYLSGQARSRARAAIWVAIAVVLVAGASATVSRTITVMGLAMVGVALLLRGARLKRYWPVLLVLPVAVHFMAPGTMGGIFKAFGSISIGGDDPRAGLQGSGRMSDIVPGLRFWVKSPLVGQGLGRSLPSYEHPERTPGQLPASLIFDDQYLGTLVSLGILGFVAVLSFVWGAAIRLFKAAKRATGPPGDLLVACTVSVVGYATSMLLFDAFAFVQGGLVFFAIVALGLVTAASTRPPVAPNGEATP